MDRRAATAPATERQTVEVMPVDTFVPDPPGADGPVASLHAPMAGQPSDRAVDEVAPVPPEDTTLAPADPAPEGAAASPGASTLPHDARVALTYLVTELSDDYIAVMDVLEASVADLAPADIAAAVASNGRPLAEAVVEARLESLRQWGAVHATSDTSRILRHSDLLARNWRYTPTAVGRQVQRFYRTVLVGPAVAREIPIAALNRVVRALESLRSDTAADVPEAISTIFVNHDALDAALVGAEDTLAALSDRYDLDHDDTAELRSLLVNYATRVAAELEEGAALASLHLAALRDRFPALAETAVAASEARTLIALGALTAAKGGRVDDWEGLCAWFDPVSGRAFRFSLRLVRALPGMHANLRRLHTSSGSATSRARALQLAAACNQHPTRAVAVTLAALGDHRWRKLFGAADDDELIRTPSWATGPQLDVPDLLRLTGRSGARGRPPAARDDKEARAAVRARRERVAQERAAAIAEILAAAPGTHLSSPAARLAMELLMATVRRPANRKGIRTTAAPDIACSVFRPTPPHTTGAAHSRRPRPLIVSDRFRIWLPGRTGVFHRPGEALSFPEGLEDPEPRARLILAGAVA